MTHRTRIKVGMAYNLGLLQLSSSLKPVLGAELLKWKWRQGRPAMHNWSMDQGPLKMPAHILSLKYQLSTARMLGSSPVLAMFSPHWWTMRTNLDFWVKFPNETCSQLFPSQQIAWKPAMEKETGLGPVEIHSRPLVMLSSWHCSILFTIVILDGIKLASKDMKQLLICVHGSPWMPVCSFVCTQMFPLFHIATARETIEIINAFNRTCT